MEDIDAFERHIAKTKTLYNDYSTITSSGREVIMPKSERQNLILGLNLLFLLSQNRMCAGMHGPGVNHSDRIRMAVLHEWVRKEVNDGPPVRPLPLPLRSLAGC